MYVFDRFVLLLHHCGKETEYDTRCTASEFTHESLCLSCLAMLLVFFSTLLLNTQHVLLFFDRTVQDIQSLTTGLTYP